MAIYIKFDGIDGESQNRGLGIPNISSMEIIKTVDKTSPILFDRLCEGKTIPKVQIDVCHTGDELQTRTEYTLSDVLVSGYEDHGLVSGDHTGEEYIKLHFTKIEKKYIPYDAQNKPGSPIVVGYNLSEARSC